jgi:hypothetical protein
LHCLSQDFYYRGRALAELLQQQQQQQEEEVMHAWLGSWRTDEENFSVALTAWK